MKTKLNYVNSNSNPAKKLPVLAFIPGGPALSSKTLVGLEILSRTFDLIFVDLPGTGGQKDPESQNFDSVLADMENVLLSVERPLILAGHSFGGYIAAKLFERGKLNVKGLACLAAPFLQETYDGLAKGYEKLMTPELKKTAQSWSEEKTLENMKAWFASYGLLYFSEKNLDKGRKLIFDDQMSLSLFLGLRTAVESQNELLAFLKNSLIPKLFIAAENDRLIPPFLLEKDAKAGSFEFHILKNAAHFMNLDQSEAIAELIEDKFSGGSKGEKA